MEAFAFLHHGVKPYREIHNDNCNPDFSQGIYFTSFIPRYRRIKLLVELSCLSFGAAMLSNSGTIRWASTLPNSTPH
jgi:hypothetical protein